MKKLLSFSSVFAISAGVILLIGGLWGISFTYKNIARENITTPADAPIGQKKVRGPFTLKAQADIIREHTLKMTGGKTYSEMPREIPKLDEKGNQVLGVDGKPLMVPNTLRDVWVTVMALTTSLNLAIFAYFFSALIILFGFISLWTGIVFCKLGRNRTVN